MRNAAPKPATYRALLYESGDAGDLTGSIGETNRKRLIPALRERLSAAGDGARADLYALRGRDRRPELLARYRKTDGHVHLEEI